MPNMVYSVISVKGSKDEVLKMMNDGLRISKQDTMEALDFQILNKAHITMRSWFPMPETFDVVDTAHELHGFVNWCCCGDVMCGQDAFLNAFYRLNKKSWTDGSMTKEEVATDKYNSISNWLHTEPEEGKESNLSKAEKKLGADYQKYVDTYTKESQYQRDTYGCIGWRSYNEKSLGVNWDCELTSWHIEDENETDIVMQFVTDTPWGIAVGWFDKMQALYPALKMSVYVEHDNGEYYGWFDCDNPYTEHFVEGVHPHDEDAPDMWGNYLEHIKL